jgi:hypothetical protein
VYITEFLAGCEWAWAGLLPIAVYALLEARARGREQLRARILDNEAGAKCAHGKYRWHSCRSCAEEFVLSPSQDLQGAPDPELGGDPFPVDDQVDEDLEGIPEVQVYAPILAAAGSFFGGPVAGALIAAATVPIPSCCSPVATPESIEAARAAWLNPRMVRNG